MKQLTQILVFSAIAFALLLSVSSCKDDKDENNNTPVNTEVASCEGCHTNYAHLQEVFSPDTVAPAGWMWWRCSTLRTL
jgi:hypothetical protein